MQLRRFMEALFRQGGSKEVPLRHIYSRILHLILAEKVAEMVEKLAQPIIVTNIYAT